MRDSDIPAIRTLPLFHETADESFAELVRGAYMQRPARAACDHQCVLPSQ